MFQKNTFLGSVVKTFFVFITLFFCVSQVQAAVVHSTLQGGDWNDPATWQDGVVPGIFDSVEIHGNVYSRNRSGIIVKDILVHEGVELDVIHLSLYGNLINEGTISQNLIEVLLLGNSTPQRISGISYPFHTTRFVAQTPLYLTGEVPYISLNLNGYNLKVQDADIEFVELMGGGYIFSDIFSQKIRVSSEVMDTYGNDVEVQGELRIKNLWYYENIRANSLQLGEQGMNSQWGDGSSIEVEKLEIVGEVSYYPNQPSILSGSLIVHAHALCGLGGNVSVYGDIQNDGILDLGGGNVYGNISTNQNWGGAFNLAWQEIVGADSYDVYFDEIFLENITALSFPKDDILGTTSAHSWYVIGKDSIGNEIGRTPKRCINSSICDENPVLPFSYNNPFFNNGNILTQSNISSGTGIFFKSVEIQNSSQNNSLTQIDEISSLGDPVMLSSGEFTYSNSVMSHQGIGLPFDFQIHYKNQAYYNGPLGNNFDYSYNLYLTETQEGNINYHDGNLGAFSFVKNSENYEKNSSLQANLEKEGEDYIITFPNQKKIIFGNNKRVSKIEDVFGNALSFTYDAENKLIHITDTLGRNYILTYYSHSRLKDITDFAGNIVTFEYFSQGEGEGSEYDLKQIQLLNQGTSQNIGFTYSTGTTFEDAHNIVKLIDTKGQIYVENTYENDRVKTQKYGSGTLNYTYILSPDGKRILENQVTDRNGYRIDYSYDTTGNVLLKKIHTENGLLTTEYTYTPTGKLATEKFPRGNGYEYSYDSDDNLIEKRFKTDITVPNSHQDIVESFIYDSIFHIPTSITEANGRITTLTLSPAGKIVKKETSDGTEVSYAYSARGELISMTDEAGVTTQYTYTEGRISSITTGGNTITFVYDSFGNLISETDQLGNTRSYQYDAFRRLTESMSAEGIVKTYAYDSNNNRIKESIKLGTSGSSDIRIAYDILDNPVQILQDIDATHVAETQKLYDGNEQVTKELLPNGGIKEIEYDELGRIIREDTIYDADDSQSTSSLLLSYDSNSNLISRTLNGNTTTFVYDLFDRLIEARDSLGNTVFYSYDKAGNVTQVETKDINNLTLSQVTTSYNLQNLPIEIRVFRADGTSLLTTMNYNDKGQKISETNPLGQTKSYIYDSLGRQSEIILPNELKTKYIYDAKNQVIEEQIITPVKTLTTSYSYDDDGRKIRETDALGNYIQYSYNTLGQIIEMRDKKGIITDYSYDYAGRVLSEIRGGKTISYEYDIAGNLTKLTDALGNHTLYTYDTRGNRLSETDTFGKTTSYTYDVDGNITMKIDPNGTQIHYTYDSLNRLTGKTITLGINVGGVTSESYTYDGLGRLVSSNDSQNNQIFFTYNTLGQLTSESNNGQTVNYNYDDAGNLITTSINGETIERSYDVLNRITNIQNNSENVISYTYDALNQLSETLGNTRETMMSYDSLNRLTHLTPSSGTGYSYSYDAKSHLLQNGIDTYSYDALNQLTKVHYTDKRFGVMEGNEYSYDLMGNRIKEENTRTITRTTKTGAVVTTERKRAWDYITNSLNQYSDVLAPNSTGSTNTGSTTNTGTTNTGSTNTGTIIEETNTGSLQGRLLYDANGNLIGNMLNNKREYEYKYDYKNRLVEINRYITSTQKETLIQFTYDTLGRRLSKKVNNQLIKYTYSNQDVLEETLFTVNPTNGNQTKRETRNYIYGNKGIDDIVHMKVKKYKKVGQTYQLLSTDKYYYEKDNLGSIIKITSNTGAIIEQYTYTAYGKPYRWNQVQNKYTPVNGAASSIGNTRMYTGREYDREILLTYHRARYYDANLGRFTSRDPIGIQDDINLYTYTGNNPVNYVDRMGREKTLIIGFSGYPGPSVEYDNNDSGVYQLLQKFKNNHKVTTSFIRSDLLGYDEKEALKLIKNGDYNNLIIIGHSLGAQSAIDISAKLKGTQTVSLLVTMDLCGGYNCFTNNNQISNNVETTINYYQENDFTPNDLPSLYNKPLYQLIDYNDPILLHNYFDKRVYGENLYNQIVNNNLVKESYHTTIDNDLVNEIYNNINLQLGKK